MCLLFVGISNVKSREDLVMSNTDLSEDPVEDPFKAAPFTPIKSMNTFLKIMFFLYITLLYFGVNFFP